MGKRLGVKAGFVGVGIALVLLLSLVQVVTAQTIFNSTGSMSTARGNAGVFTLTRLADGRVLAAGGSGSSGPLSSAEIYNPTTGIWTPTAPMPTARMGHTTTLLPNGRVLIAGGHNGTYLNSAHIYDPVSNSWFSTGSLTTSRAYHTAILLNNGKILVAAGTNTTVGNATGMSAAELYDPATGSWSPTGSLVVGRYLQMGVLMADGRVLIAGGTAAGGAGGAAATSAEIYNPASGTWSATASMPTGRWQNYTLTLLANGKVLAAGGVTNWTSIATNKAEIYDPATAIWSAVANMPAALNGQSATLLINGKVLVVAGNDHPVDFLAGTYLNTALLFDPALNAWVPTANTLGESRGYHLGVGLLDGRVLVAGGANASGLLASAELYGIEPRLQIVSKFAFSGFRSGVYNIYTMNADGTSQNRLTTAGTEQNSAWSPDGSKIAYHTNKDGNNEIYTMNADGTNQTRLTSNSASDQAPHWSPDGTKIVFFSTRDGNAEIYTMNADGSGQTRLTSNSGGDAYPSWSPDGTKIVFGTDRDGNNEIYAMNADGSSPSRLTNNSAIDTNPSYSPDGSQIVFTSYRSGSAQVYVMNADGSGVTPLTSTGTNYNACWSPDGTKIAFETPRAGAGTAQVYTMNADGSNQTALISIPAAIDGNPNWNGAFRQIGSASVGSSTSRTMTIENKGDATLSVSNITSSDGQFAVSPTNFSVNAGSSQNVTVAFTPTSAGTKYSTLTITSNDLTSSTAKLTVNGTGTAPDLQIRGRVAFVTDRSGNNEVYLADSDGSNPTNLTNNGFDEYWGRWSPDGTKILFRTNRNAGSGNGNDLYVVNVDGSGLTNLTSGATGDDDRAAWSPDGSKIVFDYGSGTGQVYTMNADGSGRTQLTSTGFNNVPVWSPDGSKIAFMSNRSGNGEIWVMGSDGSSQQNLSNNSATDDTPAWSPDGSKLAFASTRDGNSEIYVMNADGTGQSNLTNDSGVGDYSPWWSPDGTKIIYSRAGEVYTINVDGSSKINITNNSASDNGPTWDTPFRIGSATTGLPVARTITIDNKGTGTLNVSNITSSDGQFTVSPTNFSVNAGSSQNVTVTFTPTSAGTKYSTLTITSNDLTSSTAKLTVNGTATAAPVPIFTFSTGTLSANTKVAFASNRDGNYEIYTMNTDGTNQTRLTNNSASDNLPAISPDGTKVAFSSTRDGNNEVYVMNIDGSSQTRLTNNGATDYATRWSPDGTKIVFLSTRDGVQEIYTMNADGSSQTRITNDAFNDDYPIWSPDGTKIAFHRDPSGTSGTPYEIYVMNVDGTNQTRLTNNSATDNLPVWSPDGTKIAFNTLRDGNGEIYVMNADGSNQTRLTNNSSVDQFVAWSPDGTKIMFSAERDGNAEVYVMNADGSSQTRITSNSATDYMPDWSPFLRTISLGTVTSGASGNEIFTVTNRGGASLSVTGISVGGTDASQFSVSPTTAAIAGGASQSFTVTFTPASTGSKTASLSISHNAGGSPATVTLSGTATAPPVADLQIREKVLFVSNRDGNDEIYSMDADGAGVTRLTTNSDQDGWPVLSPDGTKILYGRVVSGQWQLFKMNTDGSGQQQLTFTGAATDPTWSPDGTKICFYGNQSTSGDLNLFSINADGSGLTQLTNVGGQELMPRWSPDGSKIVFSSDRDGNQELYSMNSDGSSQTRLTNNSTGEYYPSWSPDGTKIFFTTDRNGNQDVYSMNPDGSNQVQLTNNSANDAYPTLSPDGTKVLFSTQRDGNVELYVMEVDGANPVRVTTAAASYEQYQSWGAYFAVGSAAIGTPVSRTMTVDNKGNTTLAVSNITSSDGQFTVSPTNFSVNAGSSQNVTVTFTPTSAGTKYSTLTITSNDATSPTAKLIVNGTVQAPAISLSATSAEVGNVNVGASGTATITVSNTGNSALTVTGITVAGTDASQFTVSPATFTVNSGAAAQTVTVTFTPTSSGAKSASLSIVHNASGSPSTVTLSGTGTAPVISFSATSASAGNVNVGASGTATITVSNTGNSALTVTGITVAGTDAPQFTVSPTAFTVNSGASAQTLTITFTPTSFGAKTASLSIAHNAGGSSATVSLSGMGNNQSPVTTDDAATANEDAAVDIDVTVNDSDPDEDAVMVIAVTHGTNGLVVINPDGTVKYTPNANFNGSDSFTYTISDGKGGEAAATVLMTIHAVNDMPTLSAISDPAAILEDAGTQTVNLSGIGTGSANETQEIVVTATSNNPQLVPYPTVTYTSPGATGSLSYAPVANGNGTAVITVTVKDDGGTNLNGIDIVTQTFTIVITPMNDAPVANAGSDQTLECTGPLTTVLLDGSVSSDVDGDALYFVWKILGGQELASGVSTERPEVHLPVGTHIIILTVSDGNGGISDDLAPDSRVTVIVQDTTPPVLTLTDGSVGAHDATVNIEIGTSYEEPGFSASDICSGNLTDAVVITGQVNSAVEGSYLLTYTVSDASGNITRATRTVNVVVSPNSYGLIARHSMDINQKATINSGFVGVVDFGQPPFVGDGVELVLGQHVATKSEVRISAPRVKVRQQADIAGTLIHRELEVGQKAVVANPVQVGTSYWPLFGPTALYDLPVFRTGASGNQDVSVKEKGQTTLAPGDYGQISVKQKGTLTFTGGTYQIKNLDIGQDVSVVFQSPTVLLIAEKFALDQKSTFGPMAGSGINASDILVYVEGSNGKNGALKSNPDAVKVGQNCVFRGNVYAPNGTVQLLQNSRATGSFIGKDIIVGQDVVVSVQSGWKTSGVVYTPQLPGATKIASTHPELQKPTLPEDVPIYTFGTDQNFPNPFNPETTIRYTLGEVSDVRLIIYNILGQEVRTLVNDMKQPGAYAVSWDGKDAFGRSVSSGIYFYQLRSNGLVDTRRMLLLK